MTSAVPSPSPPPGGAFGPSNASSKISRASSTQYAITSAPLTLSSICTTTMGTSFSATASPTSVSLQSSPEGLRGRNVPWIPSPEPFQLPDAAMPTFTHPQSAMSDAVALSKGPSLRRRISNRLTRRRKSSNQANGRDHSSGPVTIRRRSDSRNDVDVERPWTTLDFDGDDEEALDDQYVPVGVAPGIDGPGGARPEQKPKPDPEEGDGFTVPRSLQSGTTLTKVSKKKKKKKQIRFSLDVDLAKICWDTSNRAKGVYIDEIVHFKKGADASHFRKECGVPLEAEDRWFTIVYAVPERSKSRQEKTMHLIAPTKEIFQLWTSTLEAFHGYRVEFRTGLAGPFLNEKALKELWRREINKRQLPSTACDKLGFEGVESLCRSLQIFCLKDFLRAQFEKAAATDAAKLTYSEFNDLVRRLKERKDVNEIHRTLVQNTKEGLDLTEFLTFLKDVQGEDVDRNRPHWESVFYCSIQKSKTGSASVQEGHEDQPSRMNREALSTFLSSPANIIQSPQNKDGRFDQPLNQYFISSSHNTYLVGNQYMDESSVDVYERVLQRGCRSVEIDCWNGPDGRPMVMHGRTLTTRVLFADCISVIGQHASDSSPYPLFLSLEVHCNPEQQQAMVDIMRDTFGDRLVDRPYMTNALSLPSPEDLKYRILVKVKAGGNEVDHSSASASPAGRRARSFSSPFARPQILDNSAIPSGPMLSSPASGSPSEESNFWAKGSMTTTSMSSATDESDTITRPGRASKKANKKAKSKIIKSLGDLGVYTRGLKYTNYSLPESKTYNHIFSLAERMFESHCKDSDLHAQLVKHNRNYMMRVYPSSFRVTSTNFEPHPFWKHGAQMVAMNWQTYDLGMQMNDAMFAAGADRNGYVLKPEELRTSTASATSAPGFDNDKTGKKLVQFSIEVISGQQLPRPKVLGPEGRHNPYVQIEVFTADDKAKGNGNGEALSDGPNGTTSPRLVRTPIVQNNGYNPIFNREFKLSLETKHPSLVFVRWTVWHSSDGRNPANPNSNSPLATFTAKLSSLRQGYRHIPLFNGQGDHFLFPTLFCKIKKEEPVPISTPEVLTSEKVGRIKQLGQSILKRTLSVERKDSRDSLRSSPSFDY